LTTTDIPTAAEVGIRSGVHLLIALLREATKTNPELRDQTLNFLIDLFAGVKPLALWGNNKLNVVMDKSLNGVCDYLEEVIMNEKTSEFGKKSALKTLFSLGLLRGSLQNFLLVVDLLRKLKIKVEFVSNFFEGNKRMSGKRIFAL